MSKGQSLISFLFSPSLRTCKEIEINLNKNLMHYGPTHFIIRQYKSIVDFISVRTVLIKKNCRSEQFKKYLLKLQVHLSGVLVLHVYIIWIFIEPFIVNILEMKKIWSWTPKLNRETPLEIQFTLYIYKWKQLLKSKYNFV